MQEPIHYLLPISRQTAFAAADFLAGIHKESVSPDDCRQLCDLLSRRFLPSICTCMDALDHLVQMVGARDAVSANFSRNLTPASFFRDFNTSPTAPPHQLPLYTIKSRNHHLSATDFCPGFAARTHYFYQHSQRPSRCSSRDNLAFLSSMKTLSYVSGKWRF